MSSVALRALLSPYFAVLALALCWPNEPSAQSIVYKAMLERNNAVMEARTPNTGPMFELIRGKGIGPGRTLVAFVHGLFGDTRGTWRKGDRRALYELLAADDGLPALDIALIGYPSSMIGKDVRTIPQAAELLIKSIEPLLLTEQYHDIVLVGHSMGGLVALEALTTSNPLRDHTSLVLTYGTPYEGSQWAKLALYVLDNPALYALGRDEALLQSIRNRFGSSQLERTPRIVCVFEKLSPFKLFGPVVPANHQLEMCRGRTREIDLDHIAMVKPDDNSHPSYLILKEALTEPRPSWFDRTCSNASMASNCKEFLLTTTTPIQIGHSRLFPFESTEISQDHLDQYFPRIATCRGLPRHSRVAVSYHGQSEEFIGSRQADRKHPGEVPNLFWNHTLYLSVSKGDSPPSMRTSKPWAGPITASRVVDADISTETITSASGQVEVFLWNAYAWTWADNDGPVTIVPGAKVKCSLIQ